jgi:N-methylhydantoinase A
VAGRDVAVPMLDIHTVSAGGGTIARIEQLGGLNRLRVGPDSAGARPGPVAYGHGGQEPTITDANVALGYLWPETRLGGRLSLDREGARAVLGSKTAAPLDLSIEEAAAGILRIIDVQMEEAIKAISTRRGYDLRDFTLIAFGGAGPLHATRVARNLGIAEVLVPPYPGVTSALGLLMADVRHDYVRSRLEPLDQIELDSTNALFLELEADARRELESEGFSADRIKLLRQVDLRYAGQGYEVTVPAPGGTWAAPEVATLRRDFDDEHERQFGHSARDSVAEVVNYRVAGFGVVAPLLLPRAAQASQSVESARIAERTIYLAETGGETMCAVYTRDRLAVGHHFEGPAIVEQLDTTTLVLPGQSVDVDTYGNLLVRESGGS